MTREEAIRILIHETAVEALAEIEYYGGFSGKAAVVNAVSDACILAAAALREQEERELGCKYCNDRKSICNRDEDIHISGNILRIDIGCYAYSQAQINFCPMCGRRLYLPKPTTTEANS